MGTKNWWRGEKEILKNQAREERKEKSDHELLLQILHEIEEVERSVAEIKRSRCCCQQKKAVSAVLFFTNEKGESTAMDITVHINDTPMLVASLVEFDGPNGTGNIVAGIGPTSYTSSDPTVATVDPVTGQLAYLKNGQTTIKGLNSGNGMNASGVLTIISGAALSAVLEFVAPGGTVAPGAPVISLQPAPQAGGIGGAVTFTVVATGAAPLSYQWKKNGVAVAGATSALFTSQPLAASDNGASISVDVTNPNGTTTSKAALLTVS